tara:strand:+ start:148 stop:333 length:186 start_codon:yes stop_codon:yes gene_type:complete
LFSLSKVALNNTGYNKFACASLSITLLLFVGAIWRFSDKMIIYVKGGINAVYCAVKQNTKK